MPLPPYIYTCSYIFKTFKAVNIGGILGRDGDNNKRYRRAGVEALERVKGVETVALSI